MRERPLVFGQSQNLVGIVCEPATDVRRTDAPAVILWNVGIHHRVGPYRIFVDLARALAAQGFLSLRFDVAGQGDSIPSRGLVDGEPALVDLREAMAILERRFGAKTFAPVAFCSGVDVLHPLGVGDKRVVAMGYIEPYAWRTLGFWLRYPLRYFNAARWSRRFRKKVSAKVEINPSTQEAAAMGGNTFARNYPTPNGWGADLQRLSDRGVKMMFLYFGGDTDVNFAGQFWQMIGGRKLSNRARVYFDPDADHILYRSADRGQAVKALCDWLSESFPRSSTVASLVGRVAAR